MIRMISTKVRRLVDELQMPSYDGDLLMKYKSINSSSLNYRTRHKRTIILSLTNILLTDRVRRKMLRMIPIIRCGRYSLTLFSNDVAAG